MAGAGEELPLVAMLTRTGEVVSSSEGDFRAPTGGYGGLTRAGVVVSSSEGNKVVSSLNKDNIFIILLFKTKRMI